MASAARRAEQTETELAMARKIQPTRDRRDIGQVVFPLEKMLAAREFSSCCVGVEAALETDRGFAALMRRIADGPGAAKKESE